MPSATNSWYVDAPLEQVLAPRRATVGVHVVHELGAAAPAPCRDTESKSPMMMSGLKPMLEQRVGAAVDTDEHRLVLADVRAQRGEVAAVVVTAHDDQRVATRELGAQRRQRRAARR